MNSSSAIPFDDALRRVLGLRNGLRVVARTQGDSPAVLPGTPDRVRFLVVDVEDRAGGARSALLRLSPLAVRGPAPAGRTPLDSWRKEHRALRLALTPLPGALRPLGALESASPFAAVLPPLLLCREKRAWIGVVCEGCAGPRAADLPAVPRCPSCGSPGTEASTVEPPLAALSRRVRAGRSAADDPAATDAARWIPCLQCDLRDSCHPADGSAGEVASRVEPATEAPSAAALVEPVDLPVRAWLRLASGERWTAVRRGVADLSEPHLARLDAAFGRGPATALRPEHGLPFVLETFLLRLDLLRQLLESIRAIDAATGNGHLALTPETIWVGIASSNVWGSPLWTSRLRLAELTAAVGAPGEGEPPPDRNPALFPPGCSPGGSSWLEGRCLPRKSSTPLAEAKAWHFNFIPLEPAEPPPKDAAVCFAAPADRADPAALVDGKIDVAFPDVWTVRVSEPPRYAAAIERLLEREGKSPRIAIRRASSHQPADDLHAVGTIWLSWLLADPGSLESAVRVREALRGAASRPSPRWVPAAIGAAPLAYARRTEGIGRELPADLLDAALALAVRLCGAAPGAFPGQSHEPTTPESRAATYASFLEEVAWLGRSVRDRIHGYSAVDADVRALLQAIAAGA